MRRRPSGSVVTASALTLVLLLGPVRPAVAARGALLVDNGDPAKRITLVLVGDGWTSSEQAAFRERAAAVWKALTAVEPFHTYQRFFDVRRVDVVSAKSGLRHGSPLGMHFGCEGLARLLCADDSAVRRLIGDAEGPRYAIALANSAEYGGEGGDGTTTLAARSPEAGKIVQHEMGHTVGGLGDEYESAPKDADYPNLSLSDAAAMRSGQLKWARWLGAADPSGGRVGAFRGRNGLYRPTKDSIMRTLGGAYNLPSREAIIESLYRQVWLIDRTAPAPGPVDGRPRLQVFPVPLVGPRQLRVSWQVAGQPAPSGAVQGDSLDTGSLTVPPGQSVEVTATVQDTTPWVRDEAFRRDRMTGTVSWTLRG